MKILRSLKASREFYLLLFIAFIVAAITIFTDGFLDPQNIEDMALNATYIIVASIGMNLIIITGNIDVSFGSILAVAALISANMCQAGLPATVYAPAALVIGAVLGALNGLLIAYCRVPAIIATLGMTQLLRGGIILFTQGYWVTNLPASFRSIGGGRLLGIPIPILVTVVAVILAAWLMQYFPFGRSIYAVGSNRHAAELAGINPKKVVLWVYILAGLFVGIATIIYATRFTAVQSNAGKGFEMVCISAVVVGGTNIDGGSGRIAGTVLGALLSSILTTGLIFLRVSSYWVQVVLGGLIIVAVLIGTNQDRRTAKAFTRQTAK